MNHRVFQIIQPLNFDNRLPCGRHRAALFVRPFPSWCPSLFDNDPHPVRSPLVRSPRRERFELRLQSEWRGYKASGAERYVIRYSFFRRSIVAFYLSGRVINLATNCENAACLWVARQRHRKLWGGEGKRDKKREEEEMSGVGHGLTGHVRARTFCRCGD